MKPDTPAVSSRAGHRTSGNVGPALRGDANAREERFRRLYRTHLDAVVAYVIRRGPMDSVDDVVAEAFLAAWVHLDRLPRADHEQLPWLFVAARNALLNWSRSDRRRVTLSARLSMEPLHPVEDPSSGGIDPALTAALKALPDGDRELLCLLAWDALDRRQAARVLNCSLPALRLRLMRARRRLQQELSRVAAKEESDT